MLDLFMHFSVNWNF